MATRAVAVLETAVSLLKLRIGVAIAASALAGMAAASGSMPAPDAAAALLLAVLGASGAAGAFNHYHDREIDRAMPRTRSRPFASGLLKPDAAWPITFAALLFASLLLAWAAAGEMAALFVFLGAFTYGGVYTVWLKRRTAWNIVVGGLAGSFAVLAGAAAVDPVLQPVPLILAVVLFLWTPPHFWSLAAAKKEEYRAAGVPMLPVVAPERTWALAIFAHTIVLVAWSLAPLAFGQGWLYGVGAASGGAYFLWRSWHLYISPSPVTAIAAFLASLVQLLLLIAGVLLDAWLGPLSWPV